MKTVERKVKGTVKRTPSSKGFPVEKSYQASMYEESDWKDYKEDILKMANAMFIIRQDDKIRTAILRREGDYRYASKRIPPLVSQILKVPKAKRNIPAIAELLGMDAHMLEKQVELYE